MNDMFLVLAQAEQGVTCFVVPRVLEDGTRNQLDVVRLKDKLGNRSNASSELEFNGTWAHRLGDEGRGVRTRSEEHTSELQSLMRISYAVLCLNKKKSVKTEH